MSCEAILRNEIGFFDDANNTSTMLSSRLESDATFLRTIVVDRSTLLVMNVGSVVSSFIIAFILNWRLTLVVLATYPLTISGHLSEVTFVHYPPLLFIRYCNALVDTKTPFSVFPFSIRDSSCEALVVT